MQTSTTHRPRSARLLRVWWVPLCMLFVAACHTDMYNQPRYEPYDDSDFFADGKAMQAPPADTVARGNLRTDTRFYTGLENGQEIATIPVAVTADMVAQGQKQYNIFCITCHGAQGDLKGSAVAALFNPKPALLSEGPLVQAPSGHFYNTITNGVVRDGKQNMYPYNSRISPEDRWAITAYIRALQKNKEKPLDVPVDQLQ